MIHAQKYIAIPNKPAIAIQGVLPGNNKIVTPMAHGWYRIPRPRTLSVRFDVLGRRKYGRHNVIGCSTVERQGDLVRLPISYFILNPSQSGDPAAKYHIWMQRHRFEFEA
jgi:hypothetical protein